LSDVDVAVLLDEPHRDARIGAYLRLAERLQRAVGDRPVDLVLLNDAFPALAYRAIQGKILAGEHDRRRTTFEARIVGDYLDLVPTLDRYDRVLYARIRAGAFGTRNDAMIDRQVVADRLSDIQATLHQLQDRRALSLETLTHDADKRGATLYELQTCLEAMSDVANHIVAAIGLRKPRTRGESFALLAEAHVLPAPLAERLGQAMAMRNVIVHAYLDVALDLVSRALQNDLPDVEAFARHVAEYLQSLPPA
jgi:uncharacterized protein YutE (UPF0331/DUF86 family)